MASKDITSTPVAIGNCTLRVPEEHDPKHQLSLAQASIVFDSVHHKTFQH